MIFELVNWELTYCFIAAVESSDAVVLSSIFILIVRVKPVQKYILYFNFVSSLL